MKNLSLYPVDSHDHLVQPEEFKEINLRSAALEIFTDFKKHKPLMIDSQTSALAAEQEMIRSHVKMKLVVDQNKELIGLISYDDICKQSVVSMVVNGFQQHEVSVADLMRPRDSLHALEYSDIVSSCIGDVVNTLQKNGVQHCLVVDHQQQHIRGLVSASDIARKLRLNISIQKAPSFADIFTAVRGLTD
ncbi:hypothetical protein DS2_17697 [Catenovulum agarivorans DS-2]|uniref:CBS domain-containing protein n=1 Tax=Catenovulum agarivorans DS-2 TaxID=1328313 RepID=W7Q6K4_9ALTE|nr:CBS domain-containing protein [Catenovulum agarivorans]EWH08399.1 hypothetical protein DS2_17697 [Catenovulum agarivorans DS-2]